MDTSYLTTDALLFLNKTGMINFVANVKKHSRVNGILFDAFFDKEVKHFTLTHYKIFVDYATERIKKIPEYLEKQRWRNYFIRIYILHVLVINIF